MSASWFGYFGARQPRDFFGNPSLFGYFGALWCFLRVLHAKAFSAASIAWGFGEYSTLGLFGSFAPWGCLERFTVLFLAPFAVLLFSGMLRCPVALEELFTFRSSGGLHSLAVIGVHHCAALRVHLCVGFLALLNELQ